MLMGAYWLYYRNCTDVTWKRIDVLGYSNLVEKINEYLCNKQNEQRDQSILHDMTKFHNVIDQINLATEAILLTKNNGLIQNFGMGNAKLASFPNNYSQTKKIESMGL